MKIKYVGLKPDGETAFSSETGITWFPGDSFDVSDKHGQKMLNHPDVFAIDESTSEPVSEAKPVAKLSLAPGAKVELDTPASITIDGVTHDLNVLDLDAIHALANELDVKVHHKAGTDKVKAALLAAYPSE